MITQGFGLLSTIIMRGFGSGWLDRILILISTISKGLNISMALDIILKIKSALSKHLSIESQETVGLAIETTLSHGLSLWPPVLEKPLKIESILRGG